MKTPIAIAALAATAVLSGLVGRAVNRALTPEPIENLDGPYRLTELEEAQALDGATSVGMHEIHFGDLSIPCPLCGSEVDNIMVGMGTVEDADNSEGPVNDLYSIGVLYYPCGHVIHSMCLADKVANILNAEDIGKLEPGLFQDITYCAVHGGDDNGES
jgi:hypothetical protein